MLKPREAVVFIRRIFSIYLQGTTPYDIANRLTVNGILPPAKKEKWNGTTVRRIRINEKYKGEALLQKSLQKSCASVICDDRQVVLPGHVSPPHSIFGNRTSPSSRQRTPTAPQM